MTDTQKTAVQQLRELLVTLVNEDTTKQMASDFAKIGMQTLAARHIDEYNEIIEAIGPVATTVPDNVNYETFVKKFPETGKFISQDQFQEILARAVSDWNRDILAALKSVKRDKAWADKMLTMYERYVTKGEKVPTT